MKGTKALLLTRVWLFACLAFGREEVQIQIEPDGSTVGMEYVTAASQCQPAMKRITDSYPGLVNDSFSFMVHRNGDPQPCGSVTNLSIKSMERALGMLNLCDTVTLTKHQIDSLITTLLYNELPLGSCGSADDATAPEGLFGHCDMGPERTTIQPDHDRLVPTSSGSLPCRFYTREGTRITSLDSLSSLIVDLRSTSASELHLYAVPAGRMFMLAPSYVGEKFVLKHVTDLDKAGKDIVIETIR